MEGSESSLLEFIASERIRQHFPGVAAAIVVGQELTFEGVAGELDIASQVPVSTDSRFSVASISKVVTAMAALVLNQEGKLDLDADINQYLPHGCHVVNPHAPNVPLTALHLMRHRSSLVDGEENLHRWQVKGDSPVMLEQQVQRHLSLGGECFDAKEWSTSAPGEADYHYSNAGFTLLGFLVQVVAGEPFDQFTRRRIFEPLQMDAATWHMGAVPEAAKHHVANTYRYDPATRSFTEYGYYGVPEWPACQLRLSLKDLYRLLCEFTYHSANLNQHRTSGMNSCMSSDMSLQRVLSNKSYQLMCPDTFQDGLAWWGTDAWYGYKEGDVWLHGGFMDGVRTQINFYPKLNAGLIILCNAEGDYKQIEHRLKQEMLRMCCP